MKPIALFVFTFLVCFTCNCQWQSRNLLSGINDAFVFADSTIVVVGDCGRVMVKRGLSSSWRWIDIPSAGHIRDLIFANDTLTFGTSDGEVFQSTTHGESWTQTLKTNLSIVSIQKLGDTVLIGADNGTVSMYLHGKLLFVSKIDTLPITSIHFYSGIEAVAIASDIYFTNSRIWKLKNEVWKRQLDTLTIPSNVLSTGSNGLIAVGNTPSTSQIIESTDRGETWNIVIDSLYNNVSKQSLFIFNLTRYQSGKVAFSGWDCVGKIDLQNRRLVDTSEIVESSGLNNALDMTTAIVEGPGFEVLCVGSTGNGRVAIRRNGEKAWTFESDLVSHILYNRDVQRCTNTVSSSAGILLGIRNKGSIFRSTDEGCTWKLGFTRTVTHKLSEDHFTNQFNITAGKNGRIVAIGDFDTLAFSVIGSDDYGKTWKPEQYIPNCRSGFIQPDNRGVLVCGEFGSLARNRLLIHGTEDGGKTWVPIDQSSLDLVDSISYALTLSRQNSKGGFLLNARRFQTKPSVFAEEKLYYSAIQPYKFELRQKLTATTTYDAAVNSTVPLSTSPNGDFYFRRNRNIFYSSNKGVLWDSVAMPSSTGGIYHLTSNAMLFYGGSDTIFLSRDGGRTTTSIVLPPRATSDSGGPGVSQIDFDTDSTIIVSGFLKLLRLVIPKDLRRATSVEDDSRRFNRYFYITTDPNPSGGNIHVKLYGLYSIPDQLLTVRIVDILGSPVKDISKIAIDGWIQGASEFNLDLTDLPRGIYFLDMTGGGYAKSTQFVKY